MSIPEINRYFTKIISAKALLMQAEKIYKYPMDKYKLNYFQCENKNSEWQLTLVGAIRFSPWKLTINKTTTLNYGRDSRTLAEII